MDLEPGQHAEPLLAKAGHLAVSDTQAAPAAKAAALAQQEGLPAMPLQDPNPGLGWATRNQRTSFVSIPSRVGQEEASSSGRTEVLLPTAAFRQQQQRQQQQQLGTHTPVRARAAVSAPQRPDPTSPWLEGELDPKGAGAFDLLQSFSDLCRMGHLDSAERLVEGCVHAGRHDVLQRCGSRGGLTCRKPCCPAIGQ